MGVDPTTRDAGRLPLRAAVLLVALVAAWSAVAATAIGDATPFFTRGEPREALVVQAIARGEGWVLPARNGDEIPSKPPLMHWLGALAAAAGDGVTERAVRTPGFFASLAAVVATAGAAWSWWGPTTAVLATAMLLTAFQWTASAVSARVDMLLASTVTLALLAFAIANDLGRRIPVVAFVLVAAATLTKGPVGLVLPVVVVVATLALRGELRFLERRDAVLLAAAAATAGAWYLAALVVGGEAFFAKQILKENVFRVLDPDSVDAGHVRPFWYHAPLLLAGLAPWSLFLPGLAASAVRRLGPVRRTGGEAGAVSAPAWEPDEGVAGQARRLARMDRHVLFALVWGGATFLLFSAAGSKRAVYLLPAYPAFAMLLARGWTLMLAEPPWGAARALLVGGAALATALLAVVALLLSAAALSMPVGPLLAPVLGATDLANLDAVLGAVRDERAGVLAAALVAGASAVVLWRSARADRWERVAMATAAAVLAVSATAASSVLPSLAARRSPRDFVARVGALLPAGTPLSFYRTLDYGAAFYRGAPIPVRKTLADVPEIDGAWLLTQAALLPGLREEARRLDTGGNEAGAYEVEEALASEDVEAPDRVALVLVRIARRIGDDDSGGN